MTRTFTGLRAEIAAPAAPPQLGRAAAVAPLPAAQRAAVASALLGAPQSGGGSAAAAALPPGQAAPAAPSSPVATAAAAAPAPRPMTPEDVLAEVLPDVRGIPALYTRTSALARPPPPRGAAEAIGAGEGSPSTNSLMQSFEKVQLTESPADGDRDSVVPPDIVRTQEAAEVAVDGGGAGLLILPHPALFVWIIAVSDRECHRGVTAPPVSRWRRCGGKPSRIVRRAPTCERSRSARRSSQRTVQAVPGRLSVLSISHSKSVFYGASVWACRALYSPKRWFSARAVTCGDGNTCAASGPQGA